MLFLTFIRRSNSRNLFFKLGYHNTLFLIILLVVFFLGLISSTYFITSITYNFIFCIIIDIIVSTKIISYIIIIIVIIGI